MLGSVRDFVEVLVCVENVSSYAEYHQSEMTELEFLSEVAEQADCGILLDVNNIYVSSKNQAFDPYEYLNNIPHRRVGQIHIAGHSKFENFILDTHDHPVLGPVWKMYAHAIQLNILLSLKASVSAPAGSAKRNNGSDARLSINEMKSPDGHIRFIVHVAAVS